MIFFIWKFRTQNQAEFMTNIRYSTDNQNWKTAVKKKNSWKWLQIWKNVYEKYTKNLIQFKESTKKIIKSKYIKEFLKCIF